MKQITAILTAIFCFIGVANSSPIGQGALHSFTFFASPGCTGNDYYIQPGVYNNGNLGAGLYPTAASTIVGVDLRGFGFVASNDYYVLGKTQPYGDIISPYQGGAFGVRSPYWFPGGAGYPLDPNTSTDQLHLHYWCATNESVSLWLTVTYTTP